MEGPLPPPSRPSDSQAILFQPSETSILERSVRWENRPARRMCTVGYAEDDGNGLTPAIMSCFSAESWLCKNVWPIYGW